MSQPGPVIAEVSEAEYKAFASRHATSEEIGPIQTALDAGVRKSKTVDYDQVLVGLTGCGKLCAVADFHLYPSETNRERRALKLDSVIVDQKLRRRGLAGLLVAQTMKNLVTAPSRKVANIYAHSVHPATVRLLRRLGFRDPNPLGAPISHLSLEHENRNPFLAVCEADVRVHLNMLKMQCQFCRNGDKRARPWCVPRGEKPKPC
jgi:hypothetical protein